MNGNQWLEQLVQYKYRRWRETEEAAAEPAPPVERPHEWRTIDSAVKMAAGDRGVLQRCRNCNAQQILVESESGRRMILRDADLGETCGAR